MAVKSKRLRFEILKRDGYRCKYCGANGEKVTLHVDHVFPESKGGKDNPSNLVTACSDCNFGKSDVEISQKRMPIPSKTKVELDEIDRHIAHGRDAIGSLLSQVQHSGSVLNNSDSTVAGVAELIGRLTEGRKPSAIVDEVIFTAIALDQASYEYGHSHTSGWPRRRQSVSGSSSPYMRSEGGY